MVLEYSARRSRNEITITPVWRNWQTRWTQNPFPLIGIAGSTPVAGIMKQIKSAYLIKPLSRCVDSFRQEYETKYNVYEIYSGGRQTLIASFNNEDNAVNYIQHLIGDKNERPNSC